MKQPLARLRVLSPLLIPLFVAVAGCQANTPTAVAPPQASATAEAPAVPPLAIAAPLPPAPVPATFDVAALADRVQPVVVNITTTTGASEGAGDPLEFFFNHNGGGNPHGQRGPVRGPKRVALGTGFIIDPSGYVVTNEHVIHDAEDVKVKLADDREFNADIVGRDPKLDLALLKLQGASNLPAAQLGSSDTLRVGEHVLAVGNPFGLGHTVTLGIVSAKERALGLGADGGRYDNFIQTDASINPGNSGGPLFNWRGEVVGINAAIRADANGIGFAIPVDDLKSVLGQLREKGHVDRGKLGLAFQPISVDLARALGLADSKGALVSEVDPAGSAARAGIKPGDVITAVNGTTISHAEELPRRVAINAPGSAIKVTVVRDHRAHDVSATLDELKDDTQVAAPPKAKPAPPPSDANGMRLGIAVSETNGNGVRVDEIIDSANVKDLEPGDVVIDVSGIKITDTASLKRALQAAKAGSIAIMKVRRGHVVQFAAVPIPK